MLDAWHLLCVARTRAVRLLPPSPWPLLPSRTKARLLLICHFQTPLTQPKGQRGLAVMTRRIKEGQNGTEKNISVQTCPNRISFLIEHLNIYIFRNFDEVNKICSLFFLQLETAIKMVPPKHLFTISFFPFVPFSLSFTILELFQCEMFSKMAR